MILNTGCRTDIPAYFSDWFYNRIREGTVMVRNPYYPQQVLSYRLDPEVVDVLCFCTKNPAPMLERLEELQRFRQFWFVTITPYEKEIEPHVPEASKVIACTRKLADRVGAGAVGWRYDPIFITEKYSLEYHLKHFAEMAKELSGCVNSCVISFIDLYEKTRRNFPRVRAVSMKEQEQLAQEMAAIGRRYGIPVRTCCENASLKRFGVDVSGCMTREVLEAATGCRLTVPGVKKSPRAECDCLLGADIGMYNTCGHGCIYCYANYDRKTVLENLQKHDPASPLLIGHLMEGDEVTVVKQVSYLDRQMRLEDFHKMV